MHPFANTGRAWVRIGLYFLVFLWLSAVIVSAAEPVLESPGVRAEQDNFLLRVIKNLFNSRELMKVLSEPQYEITALIVLNVIVFVETGLLIGFFLPGDSLLVTAGLVCYLANWNLPILLTTLSFAAIIGDSVGYSIGFQAGPRIFKREKSLFFNRDHLLAAQAFYERHGGKTIILARFVPIIRTFAPVVAGVGRMAYPRFVFFNIFGGVSWVFSMILLGYFLTPVFDPLFQNWFGPHFRVQDHVEKVIILVVFLSILPGIIVGIKHRLQKKEPALVESVK